MPQGKSYKKRPKKWGIRKVLHGSIYTQRYIKANTWKEKKRKSENYKERITKNIILRNIHWKTYAKEIMPREIHKKKNMKENIEWQILK